MGSNEEGGKKQNSGNKRKSGRRRGSKRWNPKNRDRRKPKGPVPDCARCGKPINNIHTAISDSTTGSPVHFDCIIKELTEKERLGPDERISYIGNGCFGVVTMKKGYKSFTIERRIQYETGDKKADWRRSLSSRLSR